MLALSIALLLLGAPKLPAVIKTAPLELAGQPVPKLPAVVKTAPLELALCYAGHDKCVTPKSITDKSLTSAASCHLPPRQAKRPTPPRSSPSVLRGNRGSASGVLRGQSTRPRPETP